MKFSAIVPTVATAALCAATVSAADVHVGLDLQSSKMASGATSNDGAVLQPTIEVSGMQYGGIELPMVLGFWGNMDLDDSFKPSLRSGRFSEFDLWANLDFARMIGNEDLTLYAGYLEYDYPNGGGRTDNVIDTKIGYAVPYLNPSLRVKWNVGGGSSGQCEMVGAIGHVFDLGGSGIGLGLFADIDYISQASGSAKGDGFACSTFTAKLSWSDFYVSGSYIARWDKDVLPDATRDNPSGYDVKWVAACGWNHVF